jgi:adenine specific DNA methylase Mod
MEGVITSSYKLLNKKGVMYICIDENEYTPLKQLCQEYFGADNVKTLI